MLSHVLVVDSLYYVNIPRCFCLFYLGGHWGYFQFLAIYKQCFCDHYNTCLFWSIFVGSIPQSGIAGSWGMCIFSFSKYCLTVSPNITFYTPTSDFYIFFIVVKYAWHKIDHFNHFKVYNSVAYNTFMMLYNYPQYLVPQHFHHPQKKPYTLPPATTNLLSNSTDLPILGILYKQNYISMWSFVSSFCHLSCFRG